MEWSVKPTYDRYRTLHLTDPMQQGFDVFALQTALIGCGIDIGGSADGVLGKGTSAGIREAQTRFSLTVDGMAGGLTQRELALWYARRARDKYKLPSGALNGQMEHESSFRLGNYFPHAQDDAYDAGVCQENTNEFDVQNAYTVPVAIDDLGKRIRTYYDRFEGVKDNNRRWDLAQGTWNAPGWASYLAVEEGATGAKRYASATLPDWARERIEAYIKDATVYR